MDRYGAWWSDNGELREDRGWDDWYLMPVGGISSCAPRNAVTATTRGLEVLLPEGMTPIDFDQRLTEALAPARLDRWLDTPLGRRHLAALNLDHARARRFTAYDLSSGSERVSVAKELLIFKPKQDISRLATLADRIITDEVNRTQNLSNGEFHRNCGLLPVSWTPRLGVS